MSVHTWSVRMYTIVHFVILYIIHIYISMYASSLTPIMKKGCVTTNMTLFLLYDENYLLFVYTKPLLSKQIVTCSRSQSKTQKYNFPRRATLRYVGNGMSVCSTWLTWPCVWHDCLQGIKEREKKIKKK